MIDADFLDRMNNLARQLQRQQEEMNEAIERITAVDLSGVLAAQAAFDDTISACAEQAKELGTLPTMPCIMGQLPDPPDIVGMLGGAVPDVSSMLGGLVNPNEIHEAMQRMVNPAGLAAAAQFADFSRINLPEIDYQERADAENADAPPVLEFALEVEESAIGDKEEPAPTPEPEATPKVAPPSRRPPRGGGIALRAFLLPAHRREDVLGDLEELYNDKLLPEYGSHWATYYYWREVVGMMPPWLWRACESIVQFALKFFGS